MPQISLPDIKLPDVRFRDARLRDVKLPEAGRTSPPTCDCALEFRIRVRSMRGQISFRETTDAGSTAARAAFRKLSNSGLTRGHIHRFAARQL